ncbi:MAG: SH3 domain-containing protein, partial [Bacteroidota bacterium]
SISSNIVPPAKVLFYAWVDKLRLREKPDAKSKVIAELTEGAVLDYLHEKTAFTKQVTLRGKIYDEPWLKVRSSDGLTGWVYGGGVKENKPQVDLNPTPYDKCLEQLIEGISPKSYQSCLSRARRQQLKKDKQYVSANSEGISITLLSGQKKVLKNKIGNNEKERVQYEYRYYIPQMGFFVVQVFYHEESGFLLINDKSGRETMIWGYPKAAPDYRHLLVINSTYVDTYLNNSIQIWGFTESKGFRQLWEDDLPGYVPTLGRWLEGNTAEVAFQAADNNIELGEKILQISKNELGGWEQKEKLTE